MSKKQATPSIPIAAPAMSKKEIDYVVTAIKNNWISSLGAYVERFEKNFALYCGRKYGVSVSNGTTALHLALMVLGINKSDEVIIPNFAFIAVANAVSYTGAAIVPVDIEPDTYNLDPQQIEKKITARTKAIIVVHTYGHPALMDPILKIAKKYRLLLIEDAAEAHGAEYKGKKAGCFGNISCFSFYGNKTITTGEGGMCLTNNRSLYKKMLLYRDHGMTKEKKYWHTVLGYNYRLTNIQAAIGCAQLERIETFIQKKREHAKQYLKLLEPIPNIVLPVEKGYAKNSYWMFGIRVKQKNRNSIIQQLKKRGIESRVFFYPITDQPIYKKKIDAEQYPVTKAVSYSGILLPSSVALTNHDIIYVCQTLQNILSSKL